MPKRNDTVNKDDTLGRMFVVNNDKTSQNFRQNLAYNKASLQQKKSSFVILLVENNKVVLRNVKYSS